MISMVSSDCMFWDVVAGGLTDLMADNWGSIMNIMNLNSFLSNYADFGGHNDPDLLEVGNGNLTVQETRTHFGKPYTTDTLTRSNPNKPH